MNYDRPAISGIAIAMWFIFFFPIGIILLAVRLWKHRDLSYQKVIDWKNAGATFLVIFFPFMISFFINLSAGRPMEYWVMVWVILLDLIPGIYMLWKSGQRRKQLFARYDHYRHLVLVQGVTSIQTLAETTNQRPAVVANDLQRLIYLGVFQDAFIDMYSMSIVFNQWVPADSMVNVNVTVSGGTFVPQQSRPQPQTSKTVECPGCGSSALLKPGESKACPYCDSPLAYPQHG
ncbi:hypothetical protein SAMN04487970_10666 [Paenibacillus tianmuensis]|uniref:Uncharacterized protein n=1 Tax=Paenibacillus tianmuensis TaxID=624147 RepID=A0A1G4TSW4_9BACL|nr:hypothetical protein [Paenibacillus tianmuensis]SCW84502.1 hypothetical protein SAMN04487970_10666 [Paenibacillus tianmuensis]